MKARACMEFIPSSRFTFAPRSNAASALTTKEDTAGQSKRDLFGRRLWSQRIGDSQVDIRCRTTLNPDWTGVATGAGPVWVFLDGPSNDVLPTLSSGTFPAPAACRGLRTTVVILHLPDLLEKCLHARILASASSSPSAFVSTSAPQHTPNTPSIVPVNRNSINVKPIGLTCSPGNFSMGRSLWKGMSRTPEDKTTMQRARCTSGHC